MLISFCCRYDHLTDVLNKILAERPENVIDFFEEYSRKVKEKRFKPMTDHLEDIFVPPGRYVMANKLLPLLKVTSPTAYAKNRSPSTLLRTSVNIFYVKDFDIGNLAL